MSPVLTSQCPGCKNRVARKDPNNLNVECTFCTTRKGGTYRFCWLCLREWKGPAPRSDHCDNVNCQSPLHILKNCPDIDFKDMKSVKGCPSIRACPNCGLMVEHDSRFCKSIVCKRCKVKFCFVCLDIAGECLNKPYEPCPTVAPRQTVIPKWERSVLL